MSRLIPRIALTAVGIVSATAFGQPTSFTYQGQLKRQGAPVTDLVDMRFLLFDSDTAETPLAGPIVFDGQSSNQMAVQVTNGLFAVELEFSNEAMKQGGPWLQIEVRTPHDPADAGGYTPLVPRQKLTAAPFALSVPGLAASDAGVEVEGDIHAMGAIAASAYTSNSPFIIKVNPLDIECARFDDANCYFGVGTTAPQARLHIGGAAGVDGLMFPDGSLMTTAAGIGGGDGYWSNGGANIFSNNGGNVGIGTTTPGKKLQIGDLNTPNSEGMIRFASRSGNSAELRRWDIGVPETDNIVSGAGYSFVIDDTQSGTNPEFLIKYGSGNVGIGTATPAAKLDIAASGEGAELLRFSTERPWVFRQVRTGPSAGLQLYSTVGQKLFEITAVGGENVATFIADGGNSRVGIGTISPTSRLDIVAQDGLGITGYQPFMTLRDANAGNARGRIQNANGSLHFFTEPSFATGVASLSLDHFTTTTHCADFRMGHSTRRGSPGRALVDNGNHLVLNFANDWNYVYVPGRLKTGILEITGADVAEKFLSSDDNVKPGTVMEIDPENPGKLRVAREAYSTRVAGVVSGAGDIPVGAVLGNLPGHEDAPPIALSGRVWVHCDAGKTAIAPGDLLTTSELPGHAMKATDRDRSHGAVIGKAMGALAHGERGLVLVLVNLQ